MQEPSMAISLKTPLVLATDEDLLRVSNDNPGYRFEREEDGTVVVSPTHTKGGAKSLEAAAQLRDYKKRFGGNAYDSNTGFAIGPGQAIRSPDASWVSQARIDALPPAEAEGFWPIGPDVVIEVKSDTIRSRKPSPRANALWIAARATLSQSIPRRAKSSRPAPRPMGWNLTSTR